MTNSLGKRSSPYAWDYFFAQRVHTDSRGNLLDGLDGSRLQPIESLGDITQSQWSPAAMVLLLFKAGTGLPLRELNKTYLLFILAGLYFCTPTPVITTIWLTGACNYLWMSTLIILFLSPGNFHRPELTNAPAFRRRFFYWSRHSPR